MDHILQSISQLFSPSSYSQVLLAQKILVGVCMGIGIIIGRRLARKNV